MRSESVTLTLAFTELFSHTMIMVECVQVFFCGEYYDLDTLKLSIAS